MDKDEQIIKKWKGKLFKDMSKDELISVIHEMWVLYTRHAFLSYLMYLHPSTVDFSPLFPVDALKVKEQEDE